MKLEVFNEAVKMTLVKELIPVKQVTSYEDNAEGIKVKVTLLNVEQQENIILQANFHYFIWMSQPNLSFKNLIQDLKVEYAKLKVSSQP